MRCRIPFVVLVSLAVMSGAGMRSAGAQSFVPLDLAQPSYSASAVPIGTTGLTYTLVDVANNGAAAISPGFADGDLQIEGLTGSRGRTVRIDFSGPVRLLISGKRSSGYWFSDNGDAFWEVRSSSGALVLDDPADELLVSAASPGALRFVGKLRCQGGPVSPCRDWTVRSDSLTSVELEFESDPGGPNGSAVNVRIVPVPQGWVLPFGVGCSGALARAPALDAVAGVVPTIGGVASLAIDDGPASELALTLVGLIDLGGVSLTSIGLPGCRQWAEPTVLLVSSTDAFGRSAVTLPMPTDPVFAGVRLTAQAVVTAAAATPLGVVVTNPAEVGLGL